MYVVKAKSDKIDYEASYYYLKNALDVINHLHNYWGDVTCTLSLKNDVDPDSYKYDINYGG
jgi:hypothetical protein